MAIVNSQIVEDSPQADGRRHVRERHTDHVGGIWRVAYMAEESADVNATMAARVPVLEAQIKAGELERAIEFALQDGPGVSPPLNWSTNTEFGLALRERYKISTQRDAYRIGWYVDQFNLSDVQLRNFFGLTNGQVAAARAKLEDFAAKYETLLTSKGE